MADHAKEYRKALKEGDLQKAKELIAQGVDSKQFPEEVIRPYVIYFFCEWITILPILHISSFAYY
jgi:hypothetical protein